MKSFFSIILHPTVIIASFCTLIISGKESAAFYALLLVRGLPYGVSHAILALIGILFLITGLIIHKKYVTHLFYMVGGGLLIMALIKLFVQNGGSYNYNTFKEGVPLSLFIIFCVLDVWFIGQHSSLLFSKATKVKG